METVRFLAEIVTAAVVVTLLSRALAHLEIIMVDASAIDAKLDALKALIESILPKLGDVATAVAAAKAAQAADDAAAASAALDEIGAKVDGIAAEINAATAPSVPAA